MHSFSTSAGIEFGPVSLSDLAGVNAVEQAAFGPPVYPLYFFRQAYDLWPELFWRARALESGEVLAYLVAAPERAAAQRLNLMSLAVSPKAQGQGLGKQLLNHFIGALVKQPGSCEALWLTVDPKNQAALGLYHQLGFVTSAEVADYYGPGYDRLVLTLQLGEI